VFIETHISDQGLGQAEKSIPLWRFYRLNELSGDESNWFGPNMAAVLHAFESAGFSTEICSSDGERARFHAVVREGMPEFLKIDCHEAGSYDVLVNHLFGKRETWRRPITTER